MGYLSFRDVSYSVGGQTILEGLTLDVELGETLVLLGRSGSGKTTALRLINRLLEPTAGTIFLSGRDTRTVDAIELRRGIGYVIQEFGLLPHWTVEQNVALVPRLLGCDSVDSCLNLTLGHAGVENQHVRAEVRGWRRNSDVWHRARYCRDEKPYVGQEISHGVHSSDLCFG